MTYLVLARKWRPKDFTALVGQKHVVAALRHALEQNRLHHAYLFTGTRGVGKTTLARILAKSLNCERGVTAAPCGSCAACREIDAGRFVDYVEMDAASNRGVDEMTQLLERAVYAPTAGRFKVYMIDEVHQLSGHAFNAMLKTLEEPPAHLKFILATTDPKKVPVTVLSRCLQFNLKQMPREAISAHLAFVLEKESVEFEAEALALIARSAAGSMRDALSILDQAIAHGAGSVRADSVRAMLGAIDASYLFRLLEAVAAGNAHGAIAVAGEMQARSLSFDSALQELAGLLLRVALAQSVPEAGAGEGPEHGRVAALARAIDPETTQLYYQMALQGREDLALAPDEHAGFVMTMLRMIAFRPETPGVLAEPPAPANALAQEKAPVASRETRFDGDWPRLSAQLALTGVARERARHAELVRVDGGLFELAIPKSMTHLSDRTYQEKLRAALENHLGRAVRVRVTVGEVRGASAAALEAGEREARHAAAARNVNGDRFVQDLINLFDGRIVESSIREQRK